MRKVLVGLVVAVAWVAMCLGASAPGGGGPSGSATINVSEGTVGTTVTITGPDCGDPVQGLRADGTFEPTHVAGTGVLVVTVPGWPEPFASGYAGGTNDVAGVATATFQVPDVAPGLYPISVACQSANPGLTAGVASGVAPYVFGPYSPLSFTVVAAPVPVEAQATTAG